MADPDEKPLLLDRTSRSTRGKRMTKLIDEEVEEDEMFWNQDALKEEENDVNYEEEPEIADVFDSDFEEDEPEPDDEAETIVEDRLPLKKRLIFPGKTLRKKKNKKKVLSKLEKDPEAETSSEKTKSTTERQDNAEDAEVERTVRKSTRTSVIVRQAERDAIRAALQATMKPIKRRKEGEEKRMTQEEMLLEAAETEIMNLRNLERMLAREEEVKKRAIVHKAVYNGPQIRFSSRNGTSVLEFDRGASFQSEICTSSSSYPDKSVCVVTGLPAKYRDPKTGFPYATKEAFKVIRERYLKEESDSKKQGKMDMGCLFSSISSEGFSSKRKRSRMGPTSKPSDWRLGARFRRIPALENLDDD
ncbi:SWR1 complex subunit 2 isoform X3 [Iris pallida]|uniref:SWR1 complex subunit 2 isoform X3 n=1 Tax=Iris pallida TaxID=29817 RepID=A0AAX6FU70_IRIPA|nr:SWR1 complex subunit 2 isoform X3 [Iris pallida]